MLSTKNRIKKESFAKIMKEGVFVLSDNFSLRLLGRKDNKPNLFALVVPNKVQRTSVGRHLLKRKMSAVIEKVFPSLKLGHSIIVLAKKDVSQSPFAEIEKEIIVLLKKAKVLG
jgi:ribonuclease P protein component